VRAIGRSGEEGDRPFGLLRCRLRRIDGRVALVLLVVPFLAAGLQSYGGENALRVYLFVIPGAAILAAYLFFPTTFTAPRRTLAVRGTAAERPGHSGTGDRGGHGVQGTRGVGQRGAASSRPPSPAPHSPSPWSSSADARAHTEPATTPTGDENTALES
jgi:hypothetical protein